MKLHQKYSQRTMSRMMRVLMERMYPKEVKGSELVQAILQWEMKWNQMRKGQPGGTIPELWRMTALMKMCPKEIKHNIELSWERYSWTSGWMRSTRRRGAISVRRTATWLVNAPRRAKVREG